MMITTDKFFQGENQTSPFFEGWYFKHQIEHEVYSFIPGYSIAENGERCPFIQVISHEQSEIFFFDSDQLFVAKDHLFIEIGKNTFSEKGLSLSLTSPNLTITGTIDYGSFTPLRRTNYAPSIMGPFSYLSFMECYHGILSMKHSLKGQLTWNNQQIDFTHGIGYLEKDWGSSFPATYLWAQCNQFEMIDAKFFFSAAEIPFLKGRFLGVISVLQVNNEEYRFGTYYGAKILSIFRKENNLVIIMKQQQLELTIEVQTEGGHPLMAPHQGLMNRIIREKASTEITVTLQKNKEIIFKQKGNAAGFEEVGYLRGFSY
jgi:tocopherol cyclase